MGDRAVIQLTNKAGNVSPCLYLHWSGEHVAAILKRTQEQMKGRPGDVEYAFARLVQQATEGDKSNLSIGVWNQTDKLTAEDSHGDAGAFLVDVTNETWIVRMGGGYGIPETSDLTTAILD